MAATYDGSIRINTKIDQAGAQTGLKALTSSLKGFVVAAGIAFGVSQIVNFTKASVAAANQLTNALTGLQSVAEGTGNSFDEAKSFIDEFTKDGLIPASNAVTAYKNLLARGYNTEQIEQTLTNLKDAAAFGRQASYTLGDAVQSATEGLKNENSILVDNAGVTKNVAKMWEDYAKSIGTTANNLTKEQKILAEVNGIMAETQWQTGDAAKLTDTFSGQTSMLTANLTKLKVAIGNAIIPILKAVLPYINAVVQGLTNFAQTVANFVQSAFGAVTTADTIQNTTDALSDLTTATEANAKATEKANGELAKFDELNTLSDVSTGANSSTTATASASGSSTIIPDEIKAPNTSKVTNTFNKLSMLIAKTFSPSFEAWNTAFGKLAAPAENALSRISASVSGLWNDTFLPFGEYLIFEWVPGIVNSFSETFAPIFADVLPLIWDNWAKDFELASYIISDAVNNIIKPAFGAIKTVWDDIMQGISDMWAEKGAALTSGITTTLETIRNIIKITYDQFIKPVLTTLGSQIDNLWNDHLKGLWENISSFFGSLGVFIMTIWNNFLAPFITWIITYVAPVVVAAVKQITQFIMDLFGLLSDAIGGLLKSLGGLLDFFTGIFTGDLTTAMQGLADFFVGLVEGVWGAIKGIINLVIDALNLVWGLIYSTIVGNANSILGIVEKVGESLGQDWSVTVPSEPPLIPRLAQGAVIPPNREFLAVLGDQKSGTNIETPLDTMIQAFKSALSDVGGTGGGGNIQVTIELDGKTLARQLYPYNQAETNRRGTTLISTEGVS